MTIWAIRENIAPFERANHKPVQLTSGPVNTYAPVPSPDGKRLFVGGHQQRSEMVRYDGRSKAFVPFLSGAWAMTCERGRSISHSPNRFR
jgi:hypothetical protein